MLRRCVRSAAVVPGIPYCGRAFATESNTVASATGATAASPSTATSDVASNQQNLAGTVPTDWECGCGYRNFAKRTSCYKCKKPKAPGALPVASGAAAEDLLFASLHLPKPTSTKPAAGDWECECGCSNFAKRALCFRCQKPRASASQSAPFVLRHGDWLCKCGNVNFSWRVACFTCEKPRESSMEKPLQLRMGDWVCTKCKAINFQGKTECHECHRKPSPEELAAAFQYRKLHGGEWVCAKCNVVNWKNRTECFKCQAPKGTAKSPTSDAPSLAKIVAIGDWLCSCGCNNFRKRKNCFRCGILRPAKGKEDDEDGGEETVTL